jgi:DNA-binding CsgD family transcriptional regulator
VLDSSPGDNSPGASGLIDRESELGELEQFALSGPSDPVLVVTGGPGAGKTALWEAGLGLARARGCRVLVARPSQAEGQHPFAALFDLLEEVGPDVLGRLPAPQRVALEVALLRSQPADIAPEPLAIAVGLLGVLRGLAAAGPVLVAVDDLQWLDPASADALAFAARRLHGQACRFLFARRLGQTTEVESALSRAGARRVEVGPLSLEGTHRLLSQRLGLNMAPRTLSQVFEATQGIPLLVLELGRMLAARATPDFGSDLPVTDLADNPFLGRVAALPRSALRALLAVSLGQARGAGISLPMLAGVTDLAAVDDLVAARLLMVDGGQVRPSHPLLAEAARRVSSAGDRRALHLDLARSAEDETVSARHLALATTRPDAGLAGVIAAAAGAAIRRGAAHHAADLAEHALRLTPSAAAEYPDRLLALGECLVTIGELRRALELVAPRVGELPAGAVRARAHLLIADAGNLAEHEAHLELALAQSQDEPGLHATVLAAKSILLSVLRVRRISEALACALQARELAAACGADGPHVLSALAWARVMAGLPLDDLTILPARPEPGWLYQDSIDRQAGIQLLFRGRVHAAREVFQRLRALADERGEARIRAVLQVHSCEVELRAGQVRECARLLDQHHEWTGLDDVEPNRARCQALLAAVRGRPEDTRRWAAAVAAAAAAAADPEDVLWDELEVRRAQGISWLQANRPGQAAMALSPVWERTQREGVDEPGALPVAPELVEALVRLDRTEEAAAITSRLRDLAEAQDHPWAAATADRCAAAIALASGYDEDAAARLAAAAAALGELGLGFDRARSLLWLGQMARRARKRAIAWRFLQAAADAFDELGSVGWAQQVRAELARLGFRPAPDSELTAAEQRVAALAAEGMSNKQIAQQLFTAVHTVEVHLVHVYAKLGVRSRAQLASQLTRLPARGAED